MGGDQHHQPTVVGSLRRYWLLSFVLIATSVGATYYVVTTLPRAYEATAELVVEDRVASSFFDVGTASRPERYLADQAAILRSPTVASRAIELEPSMGTLEEVMKHRKVLADAESSLIEILYEDETAELAMAGANALAEAYQDLNLESESREIEAALDEIGLSLATVDENLEELQIQIDTSISENPSETALQRQLATSLTRQVQLQNELLAATEERQVVIRAELADIATQVTTMMNLRSLNLDDPTLTGLFEEQRQAIERKNQLLQSRDELTAETRRENSGIVLFSPAVFARNQVKLPITLAGGLMVGVVLAACATFALANSRRRFESKSDTEDLLGVPLVAEIPRFRTRRNKGDLPVVTDPGSVAAEGFRFIATTLAMRPERSVRSANGASHLGIKPARVIAVVSAASGDGKSVVVANTAIECARQGHRVLALDADFGQQSLSVMLTGRTTRSGITEIMHNGKPLSEAVHRVNIGHGVSLDVLGKGSASFDKPDWFGTLGAKTFFAEVNREYDLVLVDTPPLTRVAYAMGLAKFATGILVVVAHRSRVGPVADLADRLQMIEADVLGHVYNLAPLRESTYTSYAPTFEAVVEPARKRALTG